MHPTASNSDASAGDEPIEIRYELTEADMAAFYRDASETFAEAKPAWAAIHRKRRISIAVGIASTVASAVALYFSIPTLGAFDPPIMLAVVFAAGAAGAWWTEAQCRTQYSPANLSQWYAAQAQSPQARYSVGPQVLRIGPDGVRYSCPHHDVHQKWSGIVGVTTATHGVYIRRQDTHCFIVPRRAFANPEGAEAFAALAMAWLDGAGHGEHREARRFLAENDAPCPQCNYNLRAVTSLRCPECGLAVEPDDLNTNEPSNG